MRVTYDNSSSADPTLTWTGTEYGIAWQDYRDGNAEIYFARLDSSGQKIGSDLRVTFNLTTSYHPILVWIGSRYAITFFDPSYGKAYFIKVACCDDVDLDTYTEAPCWGGDCDDTDATFYPGALGICDDRDNDCDGTVDEGFEVPGNTEGLTFAENKQLSVIPSKMLVELSKYLLQIEK